MLIILTKPLTVVIIWIFLLLTIADSFLIAKTMYHASMSILLRVDLQLYTYCRKTLGEYRDFQIAIDYEMKLKIYHIFIFNWTFLRLVGCVYIVNLNIISWRYTEYKLNA